MRIAPSELILSLLLLASCQPASQAPSELSTSDREAIRETIAANVRTALAGDAEGFAALYTDDAMLLPPGADPVVGRDNIRALFEAMSVSEFTSELVEVEGRGDLAFGRGNHSWVFTVGEASEAVNESGKWVAVWKRQPNGSWLIWRDIWNNDPPESEGL